jgi:hypothetical protein
VLLVELHDGAGTLEQKGVPRLSRGVDRIGGQDLQARVEDGSSRGRPTHHSGVDEERAVVDRHDSVGDARPIARHVGAGP